MNALRVWVVYDNWEQDFHSAWETQREADAAALTLNQDQWARTTGTWYDRYTVDCLREDDPIVVQDLGLSEVPL